MGTMLLYRWYKTVVRYSKVFCLKFLAESQFSQKTKFWFLAPLLWTCEDSNICKIPYNFAQSLSAWRCPLGHCITLGHTQRPPLWYKGGGGVGWWTPPPLQCSFWYVAVSQKNFAFTVKPLIFSTQWGIFCGGWHCWISVTSQNKVAILATRLGFIKN